MALAVRRLVLRSKSFHYRRPVVSRIQLPLQLNLYQRNFHQSPIRAKEDEQSQPPKPSKASKSNAVKETKEDDNAVASTQDSVESQSVAVASLEEAANKMQEKLGRELTEAEAQKLTEDYMQFLIESGDKEKIQDLMAVFETPQEQRDEMMRLLDSMEQIDKETASYTELAKALQQAGSDPNALEAIFKESDIDLEALEKGELSAEAEDAILGGEDKEIFSEAKDEDEVERLAWEQMQRLRGLSDAQIEKERKQEDLEELLLDLDPSTRAQVQKSLEEGIEASSGPVDLEKLLNDDRLFETLKKEGSLHELWRRLGWINEQGELQRRDLRKFFNIVQKVDPQKRKFLLEAWERDDTFTNQFFQTDEIQDPDALPRVKEKLGFWNYEDDEGLGEDEVFQQDDLPRAGHQELELRREIREYARWMVWELPLLSKLAKPFTPPTQDQVLRFRYTTYLGENHPSEKKIVVEFSPDRLDLTEIQRNKLIKLAGVRYNPSTRIVKISCESFETPAQNKRYLGDLVEVLIKEAKDPADTFEDVPFDFRHHKPKVFHEFPEEWKLTPERKAELLAKRQQEHLLEHMRQDSGTIVDGKVYLPGGPEAREAEKSRATQIAQESLLEAPEFGAERERERVMVRRETRVSAERMTSIAERKARRSAKRDANTRRMMVLLKKRHVEEERMRSVPSASQ